MNCIFVFIIILCLTLFSIKAPSAEEKKVAPKKMITAPHFFNLGKANGNDILKMECQGQGDEYSNIDCEFTQVLIIKKTESELAEEREKRKQEYSKLTDKEFNKEKKNLKLGEITKQRRALLDSLTPEKKRYTEKLFSSMQNIERSKNKAELIKALEEVYEFEDRCCTIRINTWKEQFQKISRLKWIANPGPQGLCNVVRISTLESYDDDYVLWKYTDVTVSVDYDKKRNNLGDKLCAEIELNKPVIYSWDIPTESILDCQCIKYSLW